MAADSAKVSEFMGLTGTDAAFATSFLEQHGWEVNLAVNTFLETDIPDEPQDVRKPLPARSDQLVEHDLSMLMMRSKPKSTNPWKDNNLAGIFRPPTELCFRGSFDELLRHASHEHKWVLVNAQENTEFASHQLNRDTWQNGQVKRLLAKSFVFWQVLADDVHGHSFISLYHPPQLPVISIIDPRTRQEMSRWMGFVDPQRLVSLLQDFLEDNDISSVAPRSSAKQTQGDSKQEPRKKVKKVQEMTDEEQLALALAASVTDCGGESSLPEETALPSSSTSSSASSTTQPTTPAQQQPPQQQQQQSTYDEPEPPVGPQVTQVQLRLPSGTKITRRFRVESKVDELYHFVASLLPPTGQKSSDFVLMTSFPKKKLQDRSATIQEARLQNSSLIVELN